jgi:hypothetical protein
LVNSSLSNPSSTHLSNRASRISSKDGLRLAL